MRWIVLVSLLFLGACGFCDEIPENADERIVARARALVLESELALTAAEREAVLTAQPETLYYRAFGPCQLEQAYIINWHLPEGTIQLHGIGNVLTLEDAQVVRVAVEG